MSSAYVGVDYSDAQSAGPGLARRMPHGIVVLCLNRCVVHFKDHEGNPEFIHTVEMGPQKPYGIIKMCEPASEDGNPTGHNGRHEVPNYDTLPRDVRPKPKLNAEGKKMLVLDHLASDPQHAPRVIAPEQYVDPATGNLHTVMEDWGMIHFQVCNPLTRQPDPVLQAEMEKDYRKRHGLKQPLERKGPIEVVIQDHPDNQQPPEALANQLLVDRLRAAEANVEQLTELVEKLLKDKAA